MGAIFSWLISKVGGYLQVGLWATVAALAGTVYLQHERNHVLSAERKATEQQLSTAQDANQSGLRAISALQGALGDCQEKFASVTEKNNSASTQSEQLRRQLQGKLVASLGHLQKLQAQATYENFLTIDLNTAYPELASVLRDTSNR